MKIEVEVEDLCYKCLENELRRRGVNVDSFNTRKDMIAYLKKNESNKLDSQTESKTTDGS